MDKSRKESRPPSVITLVNIQSGCLVLSGEARILQEAYFSVFPGSLTRMPDLQNLCQVQRTNYKFVQMNKLFRTQEY